MLDLQHQYNNCTTIPHMRVGPIYWGPPSCEELLYSCCIGVVQESNPLTNLQILELSQNQINGAIPVEIGNLKSLLALYLYHNNLIGHIPTQIGKLHSLVSVNLSHNFLSGVAPIELGTVDTLWLLDLSYNNLTGHILHTYVSIKKLNLSYNSLEGPIPYGYDQYHTFDTLIGNKNLCGIFVYFPHCLPVPAKNKSIAT